MRPDPKISPKFVVAVVEQARVIAAEEATLQSPSRLGMVVVLAGAILIGWGVMRSTWAQDVPKPTVPQASPTARPAPEPLQAIDPAPVPSPEPSKAVAFPFDRPPSPVPLPVAELPPADPAPLANDNDDPEKKAQAFVEQNRKVAESQLKSLKEEEQKLRARLQKVEGGIKRWESLLTALEKSSAASPPKGLTLTDPRTTGSSNPHALHSSPPESPVELPGGSPTDLTPITEPAKPSPR
ncbi:MAG: hypothetical protein ACLQGP_11285 [Isosphaeraceae bacterium]